MEFGEHEHQEEEMEISMHHQPLPDWEGGVSTVLGKSKLASMWYRECLKNNVVGIGGSAVDCCSKFMAATKEGTLDLLNYAARNFHRKETDDGGTTRRADIWAQELIFGERLGLRNASIGRTTCVLIGFLSYEALHKKKDQPKSISARSI